ncbi:MAG: hypothetical protein KDA85_12465, partial [Planctomycetaceae bacterium]|nr:hypothetical protein [Planctomycetaceae bacterium]
VINNALNNGSRPENLRMIPIVVPQIDTSIEAHRVATQLVHARWLGRLEAERQQAAKPWWKFWG